MMGGQDEQTVEFRQVGDTWLYAEHSAHTHSIKLTITNERTRDMSSAILTTAMARQLRDLLIRWYPQS